MKKTLNPLAGSFVPGSNQSTDRPMGADSKASIHRLLLHARVALAQRYSEPHAYHIVFERMLHRSYRLADSKGSLSLTSVSIGPPPFWKFFSLEQIDSVSNAVLSCEQDVSRHRNSDPGTFTSNEIEILRGIYLRSVKPLFPPDVRRRLVSMSVSTATSHNELEHAASYILDLFWFVYRLAFLPIIEECGLHALSACLQALTQLRLRLLVKTEAHSFLRLAVPLMILSRYYGVLVSESCGDGGPQIKSCFSQQFVTVVANVLLSNPSESLETTLEKFPTETFRDLLPVFGSVTSESLVLFGGLLSEQPFQDLPIFGLSSSARTIFDAAAGVDHEVCRKSSPEEEPEQIRFPVPVSDSAFGESVQKSMSWCGEDDSVRFATLSLAQTDVVPLSKVAQLVDGLRDAYSTAAGGTYEVLFEAFTQRSKGGESHDSEAEVPKGLQEVLEVLMTLIRPGHQSHVAALEEASRIVDSRMDEQLRRVSVKPQWISQPAKSPRVAADASQKQRISVDDTTAMLWQSETLDSTSNDDAKRTSSNGALGNSTGSVGNAFKASGSIW